MKQIVKQADKARKDHSHHDEAVKGACEKLYIMGVIHKHIQGGKNDRGEQGHAVGNLQKIHSAVYVPVEKIYQKKENKGENIARFHARRFHQRPSGDKALEQMQQ